MQPQFFDVHAGLVESAGELAIKRVQTLPDEFFDELADARHDSINTPAGEFHRVASIPVAKIEEWMRQGFDINDKNVTVQDILARLRKDAAEKFIATSKRI